MSELAGRGDGTRAVLPRGLLILFWIVLGAALLVGNGSIALWDQDEAAYAGLARSMVVEGKWVVPEFPYTNPHRKPPLGLWIFAGSFALFGVNEFALRLPNVLALLGTCAAVHWGGAFLLGRTPARLAAVILGSSVFVFAISKIALLDPLLLLCQTIAALALLRGALRPSWQVTVTLWAAVAAGVLIKGPPILILVGAMFVFLLVFHRGRGNLVHLHPWFGLPLALGPLGLWAWAAWQVDPRYVLFLGYWYVVRRAGGSTFGHGGPPGLHFLFLFVAFVPWTAFLLGALGDGWRALRRGRTAFVLLAAWLFGGWLVWEIPWSKLPTYALGAYPAVALLIAWKIRRAAGATLRASAMAGASAIQGASAAAPATAGRRYRVGSAILVGVCSVAGLGLIGALLWLRLPQVAAVAVAPVAAMMATGVAGTVFLRRARVVAGVRVLLAGMLVTQLLVWGLLIPRLDSYRAIPRQIARDVVQKSPGTAVVVARPMALPSLPFYVMQRGLRFEDVLESRRGDRESLVIDWGRVREGGIGALVQQVKAQRGPQWTEVEAAGVRLGRVRQILASGEPAAVVLDETAAEALAGELEGLPVMKYRGVVSDRLGDDRYVVVWMGVR